MQQQDQRLVERPADHRRRSNRAERHATSEACHLLDGEDLDVAASRRIAHDIPRTGRAPSKPGSRGGFKVWKTRMWKRRKAARRERALQERRLAEGSPGLTE